MIKNNLKLVQKIVTLNIILVPILLMYCISISTITILDLSLLVTGALAIYYLFKNDLILDFLKLNKSSKIILFIIVYISLNYLYNCIFLFEAPEAFDVFLRTARLIYYLLYIILVKDYFFDIKFALKTYKYIAIFATLYLILQYLLLAFFNFSLRGYLKFIPLSRPELKEFTEKLVFSIHARPRSIFAEPSQFAIFVSGYLALSLSLKLNDKLWVLIFLSLGLVISSSTTAILITIFIWILSLVLNFKKYIHNIPIKKIIIFLILLIIGIVFYFRTDKFELFLERFWYSFSNRIGGFEDYLIQITNNFDLDFILFGFGMSTNRLSSWSSGFIKLFYYYGMFGFTLFISIYARKFINGSNNQRFFLLYLFLIGIFTELWVSSWLILFLPFVFFSETKDSYVEGRVENVRY